MSSEDKREIIAWQYRGYFNRANIIFGSPGCGATQQNCKGGNEIMACKHCGDKKKVLANGYCLACTRHYQIPTNPELVKRWGF